MASNTAMIRKLQTALNTKGYKILYSTSQFYSDEQQRAITVHHIKEAVYDEDKQKNVNLDLFKSTSTIQVVLFLRDLWYEVNGKTVPTDNEVWNKKKQEYYNKTQSD